MADSNCRLPTIVDIFFGTSGFRNAVGLFITKVQQAENLAKKEAEKELCFLIESEKESIRNVLPKQESTVVKLLLSAALEYLSEYNQPYFTTNVNKPTIETNHARQG